MDITGSMHLLKSYPTKLRADLLGKGHPLYCIYLKILSESNMQTHTKKNYVTPEDRC